MSGHIYHVRHSAVISTAITMLQIKAGAAKPLEVLRAWVGQSGSVVSAQPRVQIVRKSGAATVTIAVAGTHVFKSNPDDPTAGLDLGTSATGVIATVEGTDGDIPVARGFNVLPGWEWVRVAEGELIVPGGGIIGLKFPSAPDSQTWDFGMTIQELN
jgi:hypothetical protein